MGHCLGVPFLGIWLPAPASTFCAEIELKGIRAAFPLQLCVLQGCCFPR